MNNYIFKDKNGVDYKRVTKAQAKKIYDSGIDVLICANNLRPFGFWDCGVLININDFKKYGFSEPCILNGTPENDFKKRVNEYEFYNCINSETGRYSAFYVAI